MNLNLIEDGTGASDHTSFYYKKIPVLHYFTGTHSDYHRPSDDLAYIEEEGLELVVTHVAKMVDALGPLPKEELPFVETPGKRRQSMTLDGPTLGVLPDYGFEGVGMRIIGINPGQPDRGIVFIRTDIKSEPITASLKNVHDTRLSTTISIIRDGTKQILDLQL